MGEEIITIVAMIVAGIVGFSTYKKIVGEGTKAQRFIENAKRAGHYTTGEYVGSKLQFGNDSSSSLSMRSNTLKVTYQYQVNGVRYAKKLSFQDPGKVSIDFPISITVYYDPRNPKKAVCPEEATKSQQLRSGCLTGMGVAIVALVVCFHLLRFLLGGN